MRAKILKLASTVAVALPVLLSGASVSHALTLGGMGREIAPKRPVAHMVARRETIPPFAFASFCAAQASQCEKSGNGTVVDLTKEKRAFLQRINVQVNQSVVYRDEGGANDVWAIASTSGDCEDYALAKRQRLLAAGWPSGALRIATARTPEGVGHAVLVVVTSAGDMVLDNRTNIVKPWFATQLRWIKIQSPENPRIWQAL